MVLARFHLEVASGLRIVELSQTYLFLFPKKIIKKNNIQKNNNNNTRKKKRKKMLKKFLLEVGDLY